MGFLSLRVGLFFALLGGVRTCDEHDHLLWDDYSHFQEHFQGHRRAFPSTNLPVPTRPLEWGDVNIIHTTDSHGWLLGHQKSSFPEPNYSGDFGDFASFVAHMKEIASEKDVDLLLIDTGDLHDGTGLSDGFPPGGIDAHDSNQFFAQLPYDVLAIGNHELYIYNVTLDMHTNFAPKFPGRYLSSNANITVPDGNGNNVSVPVGSRYAKFTTAKGRNVTALGVMFHFTGNDEGTTVQAPAAMVKETWFSEAIADEPDFFLLIGHMPVRNGDWPTVFNAVRAVHPTTPILLLGGHTHIRDCVQLDGRMMALESGRYMETVGWMSVNLTQTSDTDNLTFSRRYLDPNRVTFEYHTRTRNSTFDTSVGQEITQGLDALSVSYDLGFQYGIAPQDYFLTAAPYPSNSSALTLLSQEVLPVALAVNNSRANIPAFMFVQSGGLRFDIYKGPFDKNDQFTVSPFTNAFVFIPNVTINLGQQVLDGLNGVTPSKREFVEEMEETEYARGDVAKRYREWLKRMAEYDAVQKRDTENLTLGYVTHDSCPGVGDDIPHTAIQSYTSVPNYLASPLPPGVDPDSPIVDLVFTDFVQGNVLQALNSAQSNRTFTTADVGSYSDCKLNCVLGVFAQQSWN
ncbi:Metallo-dependent phosphatase-like protein [Vararia minispora EC-137]|uniref:Metallo-dependent phosphatase-like protein n=1 Tax=Vararia minispora EC-137 TaxID=1314806 RepID=A0ACB8QK47_9AGAM|nr:Metallo-dependent phosphatase-like protein [Vararia minispora EC-137]